MPCIAYETKEFRQASMDVIDQANDIIADYGAQGFTLTLRQLSISEQEWAIKRSKIGPLFFC